MKVFPVKCPFCGSSIVPQEQSSRIYMVCPNCKSTIFSEYFDESKMYYGYVRSILELFKLLKNQLINDYQYLKKKSSEGDTEAEKLANEIIEVMK
jgi:endogenous inhibitor of DNA gyrase (YacG/DUF329 family)